jgi:outer membrane protein OmpA-like peptidoglycan-associated protein
MTNMKLTPAARPVGIALAALLCISGCAPRQNVEVEKVESDFALLSDNPTAQSAAPAEFAEAQKAVRETRQAWEKRGDKEETEHLAYLAERKTQIAAWKIRQAQAEQTAANLKEQRKELLDNAQQLNTLRAEQKASQLQQSVTQYQQESAAQRQTITLLEQRLGKLQARSTARGLTLSLGDVLFETNKAELKPGAEHNLSPLVEYLRDNPDQQVVIEGHTDNVGTAEFNQSLSARRADAVKTALIHQGVEANRITARGLGESLPVASNDSAAGRLQNRRVDITLISPHAALDRQQVGQLN